MSEMNRYIYKYLCVMRMNRDIPAHEVIADTLKSNLREYVEKPCLETGIEIHGIRFREIDLQLWKYVENQILLYRGHKINV